ncbi:TPA: hypothetical protein ACX6RX_004119 [Photobacterium damselae]
MKRVFLYILLLAFSLNGSAKMLSHVFDVSTNIDISLFNYDHLVITGRNGHLPIESGILIISVGGIFTSSIMFLEAHLSSDGVIDVDKYDGETYWTLNKKEIFIDSEIKNIPFDVTIDGQEFNLNDKYKDSDSSVELTVQNKNTIDVNAEQKIKVQLTLFLEPVI